MSVTSHDIAVMMNDLANMLMDKNHDYGDAAANPPELAPRLGAELGILVRLGDKISRLKNLLSGETARVQESIDDTLMDIVGYCVLLLIVRQQGREADEDDRKTADE